MHVWIVISNVNSTNYMENCHAFVFLLCFILRVSKSYWICAVSDFFVFLSPICLIPLLYLFFQTCLKFSDSETFAFDFNRCPNVAISFSARKHITFYKFISSRLSDISTYIFIWNWCLQANVKTQKKAWKLQTAGKNFIWWSEPY